MFLSTFEKQLDAKRRIVLPADFRAQTAGSLFDGVVCFPSIEADCIEGGGQGLFDDYRKMIDELPLGDPLRLAMETVVLGGVARMAFDTAGRITLPETLCAQLGLAEGDWVTVVGMGDRFHIWSRDAFKAHWVKQREMAREGLAAYRMQQRQAKVGVAA